MKRVRCICSMYCIYSVYTSVRIIHIHMYYFVNYSISQGTHSSFQRGPTISVDLCQMGKYGNSRAAKQQILMKSFTLCTKFSV